MKRPVKPKNAFIKAVAFAAHKHRDQRRKNVDKSPYINHPIALADILANEGGIRDTQILIAAVLHDTLEDTETTVRELEYEFGKNVASIVLEVTDDKSLHKLERKRRQIAHARHLSKVRDSSNSQTRYQILGTFCHPHPRSGQSNVVASILSGLGKWLQECVARTRAWRKYLIDCCAVVHGFTDKRQVRYLSWRPLNYLSF